MMRLRIWAALGLAAVMLSGCASIPLPEQRVNHTTQAQGFVDGALIEPIEGLYDSAGKADAQAQLKLGLAMFAGRKLTGLPAATVSDADVQALDARLSAGIIAYEAANSDPEKLKGLTGADWVKILKVTADELKLIDSYHRTHTGEYWIYTALYAHKSQTLMIYQPPVCTGCAGMVRPMTVSNPVISRPVVMSAVHCVLALKVMDGVRALPVSETAQRPKSFYRFGYSDWVYPVVLAGAEAARPQVERAYETGPKACGTPERFMGLMQRMRTL